MRPGEVRTLYFNDEARLLGSGMRRVRFIREETKNQRVRLEDIANGQRLWMKVSIWEDILGATARRVEKAKAHDEKQERKRGSKGAVKQALQAA